MCLRFFTWCWVCFMFVPALAWAQHPNNKAEQAIRNEIERQSRREAGQLKRAGWKVMPNKTSIEQQVRDVRFMEAATHDQSGERLYLISSSCASDSNYLMARRKADMSARDKMVQHVISLIYNSGTENARSNGELEQLPFIAENGTVTSAHLQYVVPVLECYRIDRDGCYEVLVTIKADYARTCKIINAVLHQKK